MNSEIAFHQVDSSFIRAIAWFTGTLHVVIGKLDYQYPAPQELFHSFLKAESKGIFFARNVKALDCTKVQVNF